MKEFNFISLFFWCVARIFVRAYVCRFIRQTQKLCENSRYNKGGMNGARIKLRVAKIDYWHTAFESWGRWNIIKPYNFVYDNDSHEAHEQELKDIGFYKFKEFWIDWNLGSEAIISEKVVAAVRDLYEN